MGVVGVRAVQSMTLKAGGQRGGGRGCEPSCCWRLCTEAGSGAEAGKGVEERCAEGVRWEGVPTDALPHHRPHHHVPSRRTLADTQGAWFRPTSPAHLLDATTRALLEAAAGPGTDPDIVVAPPTPAPLLLLLLLLLLLPTASRQPPVPIAAVAGAAAAAPATATATTLLLPPLPPLPPPLLLQLLQPALMLLPDADVAAPYGCLSSPPGLPPLLWVLVLLLVLQAPLLPALAPTGSTRPQPRREVRTYIVRGVRQRRVRGRVLCRGGTGAADATYGMGRWPIPRPTILPLRPAPRSRRAYSWAPQQICF